MTRFLTVAMALGSLAAALIAGWLARSLLGVDQATALAAGLATLVVLVLLQSALTRDGEAARFRRRVEDLANLESTLSRTLQQLHARVMRLEHRDESRPLVDEALRGEVEQLRATLQGLVANVTGLELRLDRQLAGGSLRDEWTPLDFVRTAPDLAAEGGTDEIMLQPVVSLPQRRVRFYDVVGCFTSAEGPAEPASERGRRQAEAEHGALLRAVQILRGLPQKDDVALFCPVSLATLGNAGQASVLTDFMRANTVLADSLIFEIRQSELAAALPADREKMAHLGALGFRLSLSDLCHFDEDFDHLAGLGFRFVRIPANRLLARRSLGEGMELSDLLARIGIDLVVNDIMDEAAIINLLECDVRFGQGWALSPPRPVRAATVEAEIPVAPLALAE